jgi:hypothetical protein
VKILRLLPIHSIVVETAKFDIHALTDPSVVQKGGLSYQRGLQFGFENMKCYVRARDGYKCQKCKKRDTRLEVHHIIPKEAKGTDIPNNLITLCADCHKKVHAGEIKSPKIGQESVTRHATHVNIVSSNLLNWLKTLGIDVKTTVGSFTKASRLWYNIEKSHCNDAVLISLAPSIEEGNDINIEYSTIDVIRERCASKGDYQQTKGKRSQQKIPTGKIMGFRKFDKVKDGDIVAFIKGRMSSGHFVLMDIFGKKLPGPTVKAKTLKRISARRSVLVW